MMPLALRMRSLFAALLLCSLIGFPAFAQMETATLSGVIIDPNGRVVPDVEASATRIETGTIVTTKTNGAGIYFFVGLMPGHYHLTIRKPGFKEIAIKDFELNLQDKLQQNFSLEIGSVSETVTVQASVSLLNTTDGSVSTLVDQTYVSNIPLNGRSLQDLILLTPGVVTNNPQAGVSPGASGEFSVNGQRTESNYYAVDGVSANVGIFPTNPGTPAASGSLPASTALGTTQGLVSVDALEEFRVQSSSYSAEYGRNPGGQFSFVTRSGTNQWHGMAFDYIRNNFFDANDWFNNLQGLATPPERQNDFGGTLGGPVRIPAVYDGKDKTFFFFSYEGLRLLQPQEASISYVPTIALRQTAPSALQPVLNGFPLPQCPPSAPNCKEDLGNGLGEFIGTWSNPSSIDAISIRLDQAVNERLRLFFRFSDTPSNLNIRIGGNFASPSNSQPTGFTTRTYTFGSTISFSSRVSNEFRLNYSSNKGFVSGTPDNFGGATAANLLQLQGFNSGTKPTPNVMVNLLFGAFRTLLKQSAYSGEQKQWNVVDTIGMSLGRHQFKFGLDFRRLNPAVFLGSPVVNYIYFSAGSVQANSPDFGFALSFAPAFPVYTNFSAFAQDQWKLTPRLNVSMGLRWEVNPAPGASKGNLPYTVEGGSLSTLALAPQGTPLWRTAWFNFAPRLGAAYVLRSTPGYETVVRGGGGVFFDTGQQLGSYGYQGPGFSGGPQRFGRLFGSPVSFPAPPAQVSPPIVNPPVAPYTNSRVYAFPAHLQLPFTLQWNASIEQALGKSQALTVSYVGANGRRLLEQNEVDASSFNPNFGTIFFLRNGLTSNHNALQLQYQRTLAHGLQALASYTWAHTIDYGSQNASLPYIRGNSDYDIRHNFSGAFSYDPPSTFHNRFARAMLDHWGLDDRFTARTGFPVTLAGGSQVDPATGNTFNAGLNVVPGQPVYVHGLPCAVVYANGLGCPGGRAINPNAFCDPTAGPCPGSSAPRNFVRGFGAWQMDLAVRREFPIYERLRLQFRAETFNIFNHPNFGLINPSFCSPSAGPGCTFGQATATLANSLGGLGSLYQMGGPRSLQFALKLMF
jgi:hypothetical protein